ncbi:MAG: hypothetical protein PHT19_13420 [Methylococcus sp.]|nr:hypothetical protein [Methylococcus sp.]
MSKTIVFMLLFSAAINVALLYRVFDLGVTITYGEEETRQRNQQVMELEKLLPLLMGTTTQEQVLRAANKAGLEVMKSGDDGILVGMTHFSFSGNKVTSVTLN